MLIEAVTQVRVTMPPGDYWVGDLCYVMKEEWDEVCGLFFAGRDDHGCNEGGFTLGDGRTFVSFSTMYGDGCYEDQYGNEYGVDAGLIGCIDVRNIAGFNYNNQKEYKFGHIFKFTHPFTCTSKDGLLKFGRIEINTDD